MANYFTDEDDATRELINKCIEGMDDNIAKDYLINCLVAKCRSTHTPKEIFQGEYDMKIKFEADLVDRQEARKSE
jgi:hypothetical protein